MTAPPDAEVAALIELSDERERWLLQLLDAERRGFARGVASQADEYERGYGDGCLALKRAQHDAHGMVQLEMARWDGPRQDFGKRRDGDYVPRPATTADYLWLGGPPVHWGRECTSACYAYRPGRYNVAAAEAILATLPGRAGEAA